MNNPLYKSQRLGKPVEDESEHFTPCGSCGQLLDMRDLSEVFYHEEPGHKPIGVN